MEIISTENGPITWYSCVITHITDTFDIDEMRLLQVMSETLLKETMDAILCIYSCSYSTLIQRLKAGSVI